MKDSSDYTNFDSVLKETNERWYSITSKAYSKNDTQSNNGFDMNQFANMFGGNNPFGGFNGNTANTQQNSTNVNDVEEIK